ncbi:MAG: lytic murein transglycosylase [Methylophilaceae bacterium]|jgi:lytic murein transglycosylase
MLKLLFLFVILFGSVIAVPSEGDAFSVWLGSLKAEARAEKISEQTITSAFKDAQYLPSVIELDRSQPEFISTFSSYISKRVTESRIDDGRYKLYENKALLEKVEQQYGVPKNIIVAFWGLETNYGGHKGNYGLPSALMTLAYEGRRGDFFRNQLMDMMRIVDASHNNIEGMRGSWAGAMGHMQFMPSTFMAYAVDGNDDARIDIWNALPDAFASAANYLSSIGWKQKEPVALEVKLPATFAYSQAQLNIRKSTKFWTNLGVKQVDGMPLPVLESSAILLPQGWQGPAFLVASNFNAVMHWNRSINYALSVSHLADQLAAGEDKPLVNNWGVDEEAMTFNQAWAMQAKLNTLGYDSGKPDGFPGTKTQQAIRDYQLKHGLPADGYPSRELIDRVMSEN